MSRIVYDSSRYYEEKAKLPEADGAHCIICGVQLDSNKRKYCSDKCFSGWYNSVVMDWNKIRAFVLKRDGRCLSCGVKIGTPEVEFEVHHIKPISEGGSEFDPDNCRTECYDCHKDEHTRIGKKKRNNKSLEEFITIDA